MMRLRLWRQAAAPLHGLPVSTGRAARTTVTAGQSEADTEAKPFSAIPGPRSPLASAVSAFRNRHRLHEFFRDRHARYGPIYKEWMGHNQTVFISDPDTTAQILRQGGKYPFRLDIPIMRKYRQLKNETPGIALLEGEDWYRVRRVVNQPMMRIQSVARYTEAFHRVAMDFTDVLTSKRDSHNVVHHLAEELVRWSLESACRLLYDRRLGCLEEQPAPEVGEFIRAAEGGIASLNVLAFIPVRLARLAFSGLVKDFFRCQDIMMEYCKRCVDEKIREMIARGNGGSQEREAGLVEFLVSSPDIPLKDIYGNVTDIMAAAVDTTSNSVLYALHQLASHPEVQERLYADVTSVIPPGQSPTYDRLQQLPWLRAVIKETMRLYPVASMLPRILQNDIVLHGFNIPKGTPVMMSLYTMNRHEASFPDCDSFRPDRWLRDKGERDIHPFAFIPFGFGTRICVGRRIAQLEIELLLIEMIRRFRLELVDSEPLQQKTVFLTVPAKPVHLRLVSRTQE